MLYRVTPIYEGDNLVVSGVQMEAKSVEDNGEGILFNVYCYNVQPGVSIDYATGKSRLSNDGGSSAGSTEGNIDRVLVCVEHQYKEISFTKLFQFKSNERE